MLIAEAAQHYRPHRIVDIGYAQQPNQYLSEYNPSAVVDGLDLVSVDSPRGYSHVHVCDLNTDTLPYEDGAISVFTMGCTLAHVANPLRVLWKINKALAPDGVLILSSPNPNYYWENVLNIFYRYFKKRVSKAKHEEHFFEFSRYNMRTVAERTGFEVVREIGVTFQLVKTPLRFNPIKYPGLAYEIIYVLEKRGEPHSYATFESSKGIERIQTNLYE